MATLNQYSAIGRLGRDPEMNYTPNGKAVTRFSLAIDQGKDQPALWLNFIAWDTLAERLNKLLYKGAQVFVQGRVTKRKYTDRQNIERETFEIVLTNCQLLDKSKTGVANQDEDDVLTDLDEQPK